MVAASAIPGIDIESEDLIPINDAPKFIPGRPCIQSVYRHILKGNRHGIRLESILCGGKRFTSKQAIARWIAALNQPPACASPTITPKQRQRQSQAARDVLKSEYGI